MRGSMGSPNSSRSPEPVSQPLPAVEDAHIQDEETVHHRLDVRALFEEAGRQSAPPETSGEEMCSPQHPVAGLGAAPRTASGNRDLSASRDPEQRLVGWLIGGALAIAGTAFAAGYAVAVALNTPRPVPCASEPPHRDSGSTALGVSPQPAHVETRP